MHSTIDIAKENGEKANAPTLHHTEGIPAKSKHEEEQRH
jgi:hypothetical protein